MIKHLTKIGSSLGLVIEKPILELLRIDRSTPLDLCVDGEALVIRPVRVMATIPTSASDLFDNLLPAGLRQAPDRARQLDTIFCFKIEGDGDWTIDCSQEADPPSCARGASERAHITVKITSADFQAMLQDPSVGMQLYFDKKLRFSGDPARAQKIAAMFDLARSP